VQPKPRQVHIANRGSSVEPCENIAQPCDGWTGSRLIVMRYVTQVKVPLQMAS
jgi:hypothetical protein